MYSITATYRITTPPFNGRLFTVPMRVESTLPESVAHQIAGGLGLTWTEMEPIRIEFLDGRAEEEPTKAPLDDSESTSAPVTHRPVITSSGRSTSYTLHWARLPELGLVYDITQDDGFTSDTRRVHLRHGTFAQAQAWLRHRGLSL